ncbi:hypothetical protein A4X13_0g4967 [Tilletia indica]|uniref:Uncharacterized protein n=1 Tax=Tilletia indica TaxID=43049 RepID=A0A177T7G5_9BASI|nr:hypothetical protein A4X13_0g4967 [Tilletia indica]
MQGRSLAVAVLLRSAGGSSAGSGSSGSAVAVAGRAGRRAQYSSSSSSSSYIPPPSNQDLDPSGIDSNLFEEPSLDDYQHTRASLQVLSRITPLTADHDKTTAAAASHSAKSKPLFSPADMLADLISKNELARANQVLTELNNLNTDLGMPIIEYIRAAMKCMNSDDPALCDSSVVLTWLRLAPSRQHLQAQSQLKAFPDLYAGISHQHLTRLELGPRRGVQDPTFTAANTMFQNCIALFTQRGTSSQALADLREALLLSIARGYSGARDELAVKFLASHLSRRPTPSSSSSSSTAENNDNNPLLSLWTGLAYASRRGIEVRPSEHPEIYQEPIDETVHALTRSRLRRFFDIIVRSAAVRGGASLLDVIDLISRHELAIAQMENAQGKTRLRDDVDGLSFTILTSSTRKAIIGAIQKALDAGVPNEEEKEILRVAQEKFSLWGIGIKQRAELYMAASDTASKQPYDVRVGMSTVTLKECEAFRTSILDYLEEIRTATLTEGGTRTTREIRLQVVKRLTQDVHQLYEMLLRFHYAQSLESRSSLQLQRSAPAPAPIPTSSSPLEGTALEAVEPISPAQASIQARGGAPLQTVTTEKRNLVQREITKFLLPLERALPRFGQHLPPICATAAIRSLTSARRYEDAIREWALTYGNDSRAGISSPFLAMCMLEPMALQEEQTRQGLKYTRLNPCSEIPERIKVSATMPANRSDAPYSGLNRAGAVNGLNVAISACEWDSDRLSRLYKMWLAQITYLKAEEKEVISPRSGNVVILRRKVKVLEPEVNVGDEELLGYFAMFIKGFIRQRSRAVMALGPVMTVATRDRAKARGRKIRRISEERKAALARARSGDLPPGEKVPAEPSQRRGDEFEPSWSIHSKASLLSRILKIFGDVQVLGLPSFPGEVWDILLRALAGKGKDEWEGRTKVVMFARGMVDEESWVAAVAAERGVGGIKKDSSLVADIGKGKEREEEEEEGDEFSDVEGDEDEPQKKSGSRRSLLDLIGQPPRATESSFRAVLQGLDKSAKDEGFFSGHHPGTAGRSSQAWCWRKKRDVYEWMRVFLDAEQGRGVAVSGKEVEEPSSSSSLLPVRAPRMSSSTAGGKKRTGLLRNLRMKGKEERKRMSFGSGDYRARQDTVGGEGGGPNNVERARLEPGP